MSAREVRRFRSKGAICESPLLSGQRALQVAEELSEVAVVVEQPSCVGIVRPAQ